MFKWESSCIVCTVVNKTSPTHLLKYVLFSNELLSVPIHNTLFHQWVRSLCSWVLLVDDEEDNILQKTSDVPREERGGRGERREGRDEGGERGGRER